MAGVIAQQLAIAAASRVFRVFIVLSSDRLRPELKKWRAGRRQPVPVQVPVQVPMQVQVQVPMRVASASAA
jgi:hypothetical protein